MIKTPNMIGYYPFEGNGDDASGNSHDVSVYQGTYIDGINKGFYKFGGDYGINFGNILNSYIVGSTAKFSFSFWFKTGSNEIQHIITKYDDANRRQFAIVTTADKKMNFLWISNLTSLEDYTQVYSNDWTFDTDKWYHVVVNVDMTQANMVDRVTYIIDGDEKTSVEGDTSGTPTYIPTTTADFVMGVRKLSTVYPFLGSMCDVSFWSDNLTLSEAQAIYNSGKGSFYDSSVTPYNNGNLVAYWGFWDSTNAADDQVGSLDGTVIDATFQSSKFGKVLSLDGVDDYGSITDSTDFHQTRYSVFAWIRIDDNTDAVCTVFSSINSKVAGNDRGILLRIIRGNLNNYVAGGTTRDNYTSSTLLAVDTWYFVGATFDGSNVRLYINGELDSTYSCTYDPIYFTDGSNGVKVGCFYFQRLGSRLNFFGGAISSLYYFKGVLGIEDIKRLMLGLQPLRGEV